MTECLRRIHPVEDLTMSQDACRQIRRQAAQAQYGRHAKALTTAATARASRSYPLGEAHSSRHGAGRVVSARRSVLDILVHGLLAHQEYRDVHQLSTGHATASAATVLGGYQAQRSLEEVYNLRMRGD